MAKYDLKYHRVESKAVLGGGLEDKSARIGYLDEIEFHSKNTPGFYEKKLKSVERKPISYTIPAPSKVKPVERSQGR